MNPRRGHESTEHLQAKVAVSKLFDPATWSVFFEQHNADILVLHHRTRFVTAIEAEGSPKNVINNIRRNAAYGCQAVAVVSLHDHYLNQITNRINRHIERRNSMPIRVFPYSSTGLNELLSWIKKLTENRGQEK